MTQKIYIGPTIPGVVEQNRIYRDKLPDIIQKRVAADKCFARLFVSPENLITARQDLACKSSVLAVSFGKVLAEINNQR